MTPDRLRSCLTALHWSQRGLAEILRRDERQIRRWIEGRYDMPQNEASWLERRARAMEADPPPGRE